MKIVPTTRLVCCAGFAFLPAAALTTALPSAAPVSVTMMAVFIAIVLADSLGGRDRLRDLEIRLPDVVRLSGRRRGAINVQIRDPEARGRRLRIGLPLPVEIDSPHDDMAARLPRGAADSSLQWPCRALKQGRYHLDRCYMETSSPLGLWAMRSDAPLDTEIRVYPNLREDRKRLEFMLRRPDSGFHPRRQVGRGREFEKLREYVPGDGYGDIHWKATARRGRPVIKVWQVEKTREIYVILDASRLSGRVVETDGQARTTMLDRFVNAALLMGQTANHQGDRMGLVTFTDQVRTFVRAGAGQLHYRLCRDHLYTLNARRVTPDFTEVFQYIATRIRRRSLLIFLTHMDDPAVADQFVRHMEMLRRRHLLLVNAACPPRVRPLFSDGNLSTARDLYGALGGHMAWRDIMETGGRLQKRGVEFLVSDHKEICVQTVARYMDIKRRQQL